MGFTFPRISHSTRTCGRSRFIVHECMIVCKEIVACKTIINQKRLWMRCSFTHRNIYTHIINTKVHMFMIVIMYTTDI